MKRLLVFCIFALCATTAAFGQSPRPTESNVKAQIIAIEQEGWTAWKNKDKRWYLDNTIPEVVWINSDGVTNRSQALAGLATDCNVKGFALSDYKMTTNTADLVIMTYTATQDAVCAGEKVSERVRASVVYVKRNNKWREAMYMETPQSR